MKKKKLLAAVLVATLCFGLTACGDKNDAASQLSDSINDAVDGVADDVKDAVQNVADEVKDTVQDAVEDAADGGSSSEVDMTGATEQTWGDYKVSVPKGWEFKGGDVLDEKDTNVFSVKKSSFAYFDFRNESSEDVMKQKYDYNKQTYTNGQTDVSGKIGDFDWTGFQYEDGFGGYGFELYSTSGGKFIRVSSAGFKFDDPATKAVLETLKTA